MATQDAGHASCTASLTEVHRGPSVCAEKKAHRSAPRTREQSCHGLSHPVAASIFPSDRSSCPLATVTMSSSTDSFSEIHQAGPVGGGQWREHRFQCLGPTPTQCSTTPCSTGWRRPGPPEAWMAMQLGVALADQSSCQSQAVFSSSSGKTPQNAYDLCSHCISSHLLGMPTSHEVHDHNYYYYYYCQYFMDSANRENFP